MYLGIPALPFMAEAEFLPLEIRVGENEEDKGGVKTELRIGMLQSQAKKFHELPEDRK